MFSKILKAKIHNATVTQMDVNYHGSITIETYIIPGEAGSGIIGINGAAARLSAPDHRVIVIGFVYLQQPEIAAHKAKVLIVDGRNKVVEIVQH